MFNQWLKYGVSPKGNWAAHLAYGSKGGTDYMVPNGTAINAPVDCDVTAIRNNGTGGHTITVRPRVKIGDMAYFQIMHLSKLPPSGFYQAGRNIGLTGGMYKSEGSGSSDGPHVHIHAYNDKGQRVPFENYTQKDYEMATLELVKIKDDPKVYYSVNRVIRVHVPNDKTLQDYKFYINGEHGAGRCPEQGVVKTVLNLDAFGKLL